MMHDTCKHCNHHHNNHHNHQLHQGRPPDMRQGVQKGPSAHAMSSGSPCSDIDSDSEEPPDSKVAQVRNLQTGHSSDTPPTTTNRKEHVPLPPPPCQHSHSQGGTDKHTTQPLPPLHATTQEMPRWSAATPNAKEDMGSTPHHIANRPRGPSTPLMCATAARSKCHQMTQH